MDKNIVNSEKLVITLHSFSPDTSLLRHTHIKRVKQIMVNSDTVLKWTRSDILSLNA